MARKNGKDPEMRTLRTANIPKTGRPVGGPTKTMRVYRDDFCDRVREYGSLGWSDAMIAVEFGVTRRAMNSWAETRPEFKQALDEAREAALAWWERKGQRSLTRSGFNTSLYNKIIGCRFRDEYADRNVIAGDPKAPLHSITEVRRTIVRPNA